MTTTTDTEPTISELASLITQLSLKIDRLETRLGGAWDSILQLETKVEVIEAPRVTEQAITRPSNQTLALIAELKAWRLETWKTSGVYGAHNIFSNKTMHAIAANLPADRYELRLVKGIGEKTVEQYGDDILAIVKRHAQAEGGGD